MSDKLMSTFELRSAPRSGTCCEWPSAFAITWTKLTTERGWLSGSGPIRPAPRSDLLVSAEHVSRNVHYIPDSRSNSCFHLHLHLNCSHS